MPYQYPNNPAADENRNAIAHAAAHCVNTAAAAYKPLPSSFFIAVTAAMQGVYNREKSKKLMAETMLKCWDMPSGSCKALTPKSTLMVLTTASLAEKPAISEVTIRQSPKPKGTKSGVSNLPKRASML